MLAEIVKREMTMENGEYCENLAGSVSCLILAGGSSPGVSHGWPLFRHSCGRWELARYPLPHNLSTWSAQVFLCDSSELQKTQLESTRFFSLTMEGPEL
jgi:hypothetical protein